MACNTSTEAMKKFEIKEIPVAVDKKPTVVIESPIAFTGEPSVTVEEKPTAIIPEKPPTKFLFRENKSCKLHTITYDPSKSVIDQVTEYHETITTRFGKPKFFVGLSFVKIHNITYKIWQRYDDILPTLYSDYLIFAYISCHPIFMTMVGTKRLSHSVTGIDGIDKVFRQIHKLGHLNEEALHFEKEHDCLSRQVCYQGIKSLHNVPKSELHKCMNFQIHGKLFNMMTSSLNFVKLTNEHEVHRETMPFESGLIIDPIPFTFECHKAGGMSFIEDGDIDFWEKHCAETGNKKIWKRKVIIPNDANVIIYFSDDFGLQFKTDKFILRDRQPL
ncbi:MAG: hypothetical protein Edafosvirus1_52 [Edafosvirus sp.]|uniref:Uncharacterized protein n=1 Tax=Edafosvirus sp. TaxID=2487765 RepID=A0A3G4ZUP6_9VIRU|nr:MAG: hypothetical protein Edafosvirus1_52 [Edafosvirus sp.]